MAPINTAWRQNKKIQIIGEVFRKKALCIYEGYFSQTRENEEGLSLPERGLSRSGRSGLWLDRMSENIWFPCGSRANARLHSVDSQGRKIDPEVLDVAQSIAPRVIAYAEALIGDPALATSLLEESAAIVSRSLRRRTQPNTAPITNVAGYLFRAFIRRVNVTRRRQLLVSDAVAAQAGSADGPVYLEEFELKILADEFVTRCDPVTRDMFYRRIEGFSWKEIGELYGISGHAAEARFSKNLDKIRRRLGFK